MNWLDFVAGSLQIGAALYALRLNRLFGTHRVGWWLCGAFVAQALLCVLQLQESGAALPVRVGVVNVLIALMLLVAMAQIELSQRKRVRQEGEHQRARAELERLVGEKTADLVRSNEELRKEIARRHEQEQALKASEEQYRFLFTENPQPMWVFDRDSLQFLAVNSAALRLYGFSRERFGSMSAKELQPAEELPKFLEDVARPSQGVEQRGIWRHLKQDGTQAEVELSVTDFTYQHRPARLVIATDITNRLELEKQLRQAQKMEAVGQLAGGVAHDFNNLLTVIQGYLGLLLEGTHDPVTTQYLHQVNAAASRAAGLTRQLLAFSRRHFMRLEPVDLNDIIGNLAKMLHRIIGEDIVLENIFHPNLAPVLGDPGMLEQVVMNLVLNGRDAMPKGGTLTISTKMCEVGSAQARPHQGAKPGKFICVAVRDTGCGMTADVMGHLFEPFFTTKDVGKGTGLGLATVYGIVREHSGWVEVSTAVGEGSEFRVYVPCAPAPAAGPANEAAPTARVQGKETVLLVEDEDAVRRLAGLILTTHGYKVIEADCGARALALWEERAAEIDLVITDMVMPGGISGRDLAERLRQARPGLGIIFTSGYSPSRGGRDQQLLKGLKFLPKPYNADKLLKAIQEEMAAPC
jgi:PAS domain S-box-containing protein